MHFIDIIFLVVIIAVVVVRLKNVLGTRPSVKQSEISDKTAEKIFDLIVKEVRATEEKDSKKETVLKEDKETNIIEKKLSKIPNFNKDKFIQNSKNAFQMISAAFSEGNTKNLEMLVKKDLIKKLQSVIEERKSQGIIAETDFIGFEEAEIENVKISKNGIAQISMKFISDQINILKNSKNETIEGDENFIQNITDIWTFEKDINSDNPTWLLCSTKK